MDEQNWWESLKPGDEVLLRSNDGRDLRVAKYKKSTPTGIIRVESNMSYINDLAFKVSNGAPRAKYGSGWNSSYYELRPMDAGALEAVERQKLVESIRGTLYSNTEQTLRGLTTEALRTIAEALKAKVGA